ncbi:MAG: adenylate/guanylate cyclase domain-containing protein [Leptospiraceae bacterium]|nr:adenylate/guanylate cyclase domain-containing protein [Leptospiraceae bacterium]MCP5512392.1 adenylate/guanylate cyclase domain-containing protein [Leptospiraceae bacterium]
MATKRLVSKINLVSKFDKWLIGSLHDANKFIEIPLVLKGESIGVICFTSFDLKNNLNFQMVKKISLLIEQVVSAINNSRMISEINLAKEEAMIESRIAILAQKEAEQEREKADSLLKNILPDEILKELKEKGNVEPVLYDSATILFTDFKGFTKVAENLSPKELIKELDECFSFFDSLMDRYKLEKLKTIGDSYMCAGGIPIQNHSHSVDTILASLEIQSFMEEIQTIRKSMELPYWELRIGIHTGPVIAGIIGEKKFAYDVWGDTVNTASRMESSGYPGKINISYSTYLLIKDFFECSPRGSIEVKNKGRIEMYFVNGIKPDLSLHSEGRLPNGKFIELYESKFHT